MGFNPPVPQQDSNWEIRVAVLLSLLLQVLLIFLGPVRKRSSAPLASFAVWSCYLLADWVADLALGLLLSSMGNIGGGGTSTNNDADAVSPAIFAFWTPFLLLHLGGPDTITAYSVEDNELWNRHLVGLLFELLSVAVIISCSLRDNPMIPATFLVLLAGVVKYGERTYSLYASSVGSLRDSMLGPPDAGPNYEKLMTELDARTETGLIVDVPVAGPEKEAGRSAMTRELHAAGMKSVEARAYEFFLNFRPLIIDAILSSEQRSLSQGFFLARPDLTPGEAFEVVEVEANFIYDMVYTKAPVTHTAPGWALRCVCSGCLAAALAIFMLLDKRRHNISRVDTGITYALLLDGLALDAAALLMLLLSNRVTVYLEETQWLRWLARLTRRAANKQRRWSRKASQLNLIGYCLGKPEHGGRRGHCHWWLKVVADKVGLEEIVDDYVLIKRKPLMKDDSTTSSLLDFIFNGLKVVAQRLQGEEEIMEFCNRRGMGVLERLGKDIKEALQNDDEKFNVIRESVEKKDLDESLLLWHVATDLCRLKDKDGPAAMDAARMQANGETLSEYMLYLLVKQPEMLSATAGIGLRPYRDTCAELRRFSGSMDAWIENHEDLRETLLRVNTSEKPSTVKGGRSKSVLFDAVILAKALMDLNDDELMWEAVTGVWGEMLTYAASKCRGSTHVRKLNRGGELITLVWLLMQHMGLSDMYEIQEGDPSVKLTVVA